MMFMKTSVTPQCLERRKTAVCVNRFCTRQPAFYCLCAGRQYLTSSWTLAHLPASKHLPHHKCHHHHHHSSIVFMDFHGTVATAYRWGGANLQAVYVKFSLDFMYQKSLKVVNFWQLFKNTRAQQLMRWATVPEQWAEKWGLLCPFPWGQSWVPI